jgi:tRNA pseudouridine13 synthase
MLPRICHDLGALSGTTRTRPEDTRLSEQLDRFPDGGDHFWLQVRRKELSTAQTAAAVARAAGVPVEMIGHGGARDRHADVLQWFTVPKDAVENPGQLRGAGYLRKLRVVDQREGAGAMSPERVSGLELTLHLRGAGGDYELGQTLIGRLRSTGFPNYLGASLLGKGGSFAKWGRMVAAGKRLPGRIPHGPADRRRYAVAWQAQLFNRFLATRVSAGDWQTPLPGTILLTGLNGPLAGRSEELCADPEAAARRVASGEASPMGPLYGRDLPTAADAAAKLEADFLAEAGPTPALPGARRPVVARLVKASCERAKDDLVVRGVLPVDAFVSVLAEELLQPDRHLQ